MRVRLCSGLLISEIEISIGTDISITYLYHTYIIENPVTVINSILIF